MTLARCPYCKKIVKPGDDKVTLHMAHELGLIINLIFHEECAYEDPLNQALSDKISQTPRGENPDINAEYIALRDRAKEGGLRALMDTFHVVGNHPNPRMTGRKKNLEDWAIARLKRG